MNKSEERVLSIDEASEWAEQVERMRERILELEARNHILEQLALTDELTGLLNRRAFIPRLSNEISRCERYQRCVSLLYIDLDGFKAINDRNGHAEGDAVLRHVAETLRRVLRQTDIIARLGGDEFAVILLDTNLPGAAEAAERIRISISGTHRQGYSVTASIGAAAYTPDIVLAEELMNAADRLLYRAKKYGGNRVCTELSNKGI